MTDVDLGVIVAYLAAVVGIGLWCGRRTGDSESFMAARRSLPGWAIGLSMFGSYVSSISFLANPGKSFAGDWNAFVFSLATPIAAAIAVRWFVPFYRSRGRISAYEHLQERFGSWARTYAVVCFLLTQMARTGTVVYLLALAVSPMTGWGIETTILATGAIMTVYTLAGGLGAVVWTGVLQSAVLVTGPLICVGAILWRTPGGLTQILRIGAEHDKFALGGWSGSLTESTFWVVFAYGLTVNVGNFAVDQSYVQRYVAASDRREAALSVWITALLYVPVAALFFFIGTGLFAYYQARPELLPSGLGADKVFPHFIAHELPAGFAGLVVAAVFAASMDSNLNSMATLTLCDLYLPYARPRAGERERLRVLHIATLFWGVLGTAIALAMIRAESALDAWWQLAGVFSGGVLGVFLLGRLSAHTTSAAAAVSVALGVVLILWLSISTTSVWPPAFWPSSWPELRNPLHGLLTTVVGTLAIFLAGVAIAALRGSITRRGPGDRVGSK
ncbi:MAG: sodium/solute symporter [Planctomycetes bacterium]|nr:sodium/solute symporter [Planctomycetota bacterium]